MDPDAANVCPTCGEAIETGTTPCPHCGSDLAGALPVAVEASREGAILALRLLESASMHPVLAYIDEGFVPHPIDSEVPFTGGAGLLLPVTTTFAVFVPEGEAEESKQILEDARRSLPESDA